MRMNIAQGEATMLTVDARSGISPIQGIGLFAYEFIPKGTLLWVFAPGFDVVLTEEQLQALSPGAQRQARRYSYYDAAKGAYVLASDDARFCNHADDPNMGDEGDVCYATRDIQIGEEITWDYRPYGLVDFLDQPAA
jgi:uncharacterized protein